MDQAGFSLEQLRSFAAVVEEGSFSGAARRLGRGQSAITYLLQRLEDQVGAKLFDRSGYRARLTEAGRALLPRAQRVLDAAGAFQMQARAMTRGVEPELAIVVDAMFPMVPLFPALIGFEAAFPTVQTRLFVESMGSTLKTVLSGSADIGFLINASGHSDELTIHRLMDIELIRVAAPEHPLALIQSAQGGGTKEEDLGGHLQLVLTDRTAGVDSQDRGVFSNRTWRIADLGAKHGMLLAGIGWGSMPAHLVEADLANGRLVKLTTMEGADQPARSHIPTSVVHRRDRSLGPAGRWLLARSMEDRQSAADSNFKTVALLKG